MRLQPGKCAILIVLLLQGACAHVKTSRPVLLDQSTLTVLQESIAQAPGDIQPALKQELRLQAGADANAGIKTSGNYRFPPKAGLESIIYNSRLPQLNADEHFAQLFNVSADNDGIPEEYFSAALASYLLQPDYSCSHPIFSDYFGQRYKSDKPNQECLSKVPFTVITQGMKFGVRWIDPRRVSSVHLVFASEGDNIVSGFGHVALRFVICPDKAAVSDRDACDRNLFEHLVLGFQAHVNDLSISLLKGLFGGYDARLFAYKFMDFYQINAISEFRDIYSLPLLMAPEERDHFVRSLAQVHWGYSDSYSFLANNCTSMLQNALASLWGEMSQNEVMETGYIRPDHFFEAMKKSSLTNATLLADLGKAEEQGYFFPNTKPMYEKAFNVVKKAIDIPIADSLSGYVRIDPRERYQYLTDDRSYYNVLRKDQYILGAQILIEEIAYIVYEKVLMSQTAKYFSDNDIFEKENHIKAMLSTDQLVLFQECVLKPLKAMFGKLISTDGIPAPGAVGKLVQGQCPNSINKSDYDGIFRAFESIDPEGWQPIDALLYYYKESFKNIVELRKLLSNLRS